MDCPISLHIQEFSKYESIADDAQRYCDNATAVDEDIGVFGGDMEIPTSTPEENRDIAIRNLAARSKCLHEIAMVETLNARGTAVSTINGKPSEFRKKLLDPEILAAICAAQCNDLYWAQSEVIDKLLLFEQLMLERTINLGEEHPVPMRDNLNVESLMVNCGTANTIALKLGQGYTPTNTDILDTIVCVDRFSNVIFGYCDKYPEICGCYTPAVVDKKGNLLIDLIPNQSTYSKQVLYLVAMEMVYLSVLATIQCLNSKLDFAFEKYGFDADTSYGGTSNTGDSVGGDDVVDELEKLLDELHVDDHAVGIDDTDRKIKGGFYTIEPITANAKFGNNIYID